MARSFMHYDTYSNMNTQDELQKLAKDIFDFGKVVNITHNGYSTNRVTTDDGELRFIRDGSLCYEVEGFKTRYWIHTRGLRVTEIIEET